MTPCSRSRVSKWRSWDLKTGFVTTEAILLTTPQAIKSNSILIQADDRNQKFVYHILTLNFSQWNNEMHTAGDKLLLPLGCNKL